MHNKPQGKAVAIFSRCFLHNRARDGNNIAETFKPLSIVMMIDITLYSCLYSYRQQQWRSQREGDKGEYSPRQIKKNSRYVINCKLCSNSTKIHHDIAYQYIKQQVRKNFGGGEQRYRYELSSAAVPMDVPR